MYSCLQQIMLLKHYVLLLNFTEPHFPFQPGQGVCLVTGDAAVVIG